MSGTITDTIARNEGFLAVEIEVHCPWALEIRCKLLHSKVAQAIGEDNHKTHQWGVIIEWCEWCELVKNGVN